jgi:hypothetical protein
MKAELHSVAKGFVEAEIDNTGVKTDPTLQKLYVAFKDPDRIQWEFYMMEHRNTARIDTKVAHFT